MGRSYILDILDRFLNFLFLPLLILSPLSLPLFLLLPPFRVRLLLSQPGPGVAPGQGAISVEPISLKKYLCCKLHVDLKDIVCYLQVSTSGICSSSQVLK